MLPDGTPVIVSGGADGTVRVWRLADGAPVGRPIHGHGPRDGGVYAVAAGVLPEGTPVVVSGRCDGTVRVWRLADGTPVGKPLRCADGEVRVAVGTLLEGTPVIVSSDGAFDDASSTTDLAAGRRRPSWGAAARPQRTGERIGGRGLAGPYPGHRQRWQGRHGASVAGCRRHLTRASAGPIRIGTRCRHSRQSHRHCGRGRNCGPPAGAPAAHALTVQRSNRIMAGYPVHRRASAPVLTREAARRMRDSGTLSGT